jgi:hypothetical protein
MHTDYVDLFQKDTSVTKIFKVMPGLPAPIKIVGTGTFYAVMGVLANMNK